MKTNKVNLGKVCVTIDKDYWDINKDYDKLVIVEVENAYATYISRQPVPHGIDIENKEYWCLFSRYNKNYLANEGIFNVSKYLKIKDIVLNVVPLTLTEAIAACPSVVKNAGQIITFIDKNKEWQRYQYQGYNVEHWNQLTLWKDLNNVSEDIPVSEDVMSFNITEYMPGGTKYKQAIWAGIYTIDGNTPISQYRVIFGCDKNLGDVEGIDTNTSNTLAIIDVDTEIFNYILFVGNSIDGYKYQTTIRSNRDVPNWIAEAFGNNSSYILANIASLERRVNVKLTDKSSIIRVDDYLDNSKEMPNGYFMFEQQPVSQIRVLYDSDAYLLYIQAAVDGTGTMYFAFENFDEYYDSWRYLNQYTEDNCPTHVLEAFGLNVATSNKKGMMSATDKTNLDDSFKNVNYNSTTKKLIFTKNNNTTVELDATPFIKDGMVNSVSIVDGYLVITFNTDSGKETIRIALTDIFNPEDYYTKVQTDNLLGNKVDKEQGKGLSTNDYTTAEKTKLGDLPTASELTQTLGGKANTNDLARVATSGSYNDLSDQPTLDDLNKVEDLYALDATNSDWKTKVYKMFDDGTFPTMSKSFDYCNLRIYKKYASGVEADTTAINSMETTEEGLTFADGTHFSSYKIGAKYYVGYLTSFFVNNESTVLGNIEITSTKKGTIKLYLYKCAITEDAYFKINGQPTDVEMPTTDAATILSFDVNEGDVISVSPTKKIDALHYYDYGLVGMSFYSKYPVSRFANDAGYLTPQGIAGKQDKMPITQVASGTTAINAAVNTYYEVAGEVGVLAITLPTPTDLTNVSMVVIHLTAGTNPNVVIGAVDDPQPDFSAAYDISASKEYEINCMYNGDKWVVADMEVV